MHELETHGGITLKQHGKARQYVDLTILFILKELQVYLTIKITLGNNLLLASDIHMKQVPESFHILSSLLDIA